MRAQPPFFNKYVLFLVVSVGFLFTCQTICAQTSLVVPAKDAFHETRSNPACLKALRSSSITDHSKELQTLLEEEPSPEVLKSFESRWNKIELELLLMDFNWLKLIRGEGTAMQISKIPQINRYRVSPSNTYQGDPEIIFSHWSAGNEYILKKIRQGERVSLESLLDLNKLVRLSEENKEGGVLRHRPYWDDFEGLPFGFSAEDVQPALEDLLQWYDSHRTRLHPIVLAALFVQKFLTIHPFNDGNGRTGRLAMDWILISHGYPPPVFVEAPAVFMRFADERDNSQIEALERTTRAIESSLQILTNRISK